MLSDHIWAQTGGFVKLVIAPFTVWFHSLCKASQSACSVTLESQKKEKIKQGHRFYNRLSHGYWNVKIWPSIMLRLKVHLPVFTLFSVFGDWRAVVLWVWSSLCHGTQNIALQSLILHECHLLFNNFIELRRETKQ